MLRGRGQWSKIFENMQRLCAACTVQTHPKIGIRKKCSYVNILVSRTGGRRIIYMYQNCIQIVARFEIHKMGKICKQNEKCLWSVGCTFHTLEEDVIIFKSTTRPQSSGVNSKLPFNAYSNRTCQKKKKQTSADRCRHCPSD